MSRRLERRLAKLEAVAASKRTVFIWAKWGTQSEMDADAERQIAERRAAGTLSDNDQVLIVRWKARADRGPAEGSE